MIKVLTVHDIIDCMYAAFNDGYILLLKQSLILLDDSDVELISVRSISPAEMEHYLKSYNFDYADGVPHLIFAISEDGRWFIEIEAEAPF